MKKTCVFQRALFASIYKRHVFFDKCFIRFSLLKACAFQRALFSLTGALLGFLFRRTAPFLWLCPALFQASVIIKCLIPSPKKCGFLMALTNSFLPKTSGSASKIRASRWLCRVSSSKYLCFPNSSVRFLPQSTCAFPIARPGFLLKVPLLSPQLCRVCSSKYLCFPHRSVRFPPQSTGAFSMGTTRFLPPKARPL